MPIRLIDRDCEAVCQRILSVLPEWFGIPSATEAYIRHAAKAPMIVAEADGETLGYVSLSLHFGRNCEIHSMGIVPDQHRQGYGRALVEAAAKWARERNFEYLSVKTLSDAHPDPYYANTRRFYFAMGFRPFEELPELWGKDQPCLLLIRDLSR
jgi:GNAT superfamily N-acetyltransferase